MPSAIADALGKSESVVRRYLREAEAAGALLSDLLSRWKVAPPGLFEMDGGAARDCFRRGNAAMAILDPIGFRRLTDTSFSAVAGWLALAPLPDQGFGSLLWQAVVGAWPASRERRCAGPR